MARPWTDREDGPATATGSRRGTTIRDALAGREVGCVTGGETGSGLRGVDRTGRHPAAARAPETTMQIL